MHQGWEAPQCQLRGHFTGHWLSAAEHMAAVDHDPLLAARAEEVVHGLSRCQQLNGGQWVGSIPEKYFTILAEGKEWIWSPQYTLHKTMMGLYDAYRYSGDRDALEVLKHSADWFYDWTGNLIRGGRGQVIYSGECAGMLELWSDLYGATKEPRYLQLASRYAMPDIYRVLLEGGDPLTDDHANASIPWISGAARLYEVTGDVRYRHIVEEFWKDAVDERGMFATTGANAGEYWIPAKQFGRFLSSRTQEHCTVYNMIRVAQYLLRWTGDSRYADYIERALYNGTLAQQNSQTGMVSYFLPMQPGGRKLWSTETKDFWCCLGSMIQAQAMFEDLIYYREKGGLTISQFIPSKARFNSEDGQTNISMSVDTSAAASNFTRADNVTQFAIALTVESSRTSPWTLRIRKPGWALGTSAITVDDQPISVDTSKDGFIEITRKWTASRVSLSFSKRLTREPLPGDERRFALLDGPVVLAALTDTEPEPLPKDPITPQYQHQYVDGRNWQDSHFLMRARQGTVLLEPLYEVTDESYCVYFTQAL